MSPNVSGELLIKEVVKQSGENKTGANIAFYTVDNLHYS